MFRDRPKRRTVWAIVITYVVNVLVYTLVAAFMISLFFRALTGFDATTPAKEVVVAIGVYGLGCAVATQAALIGLRRTTILTNSRVLIVPSIATFAGIVGGLCVSIGSLAFKRGGLVNVAAVLIVAAAVVLIFAVRTRYHFRRLTPDACRGFEVQPLGRAPQHDNTGHDG